MTETEIVKVLLAISEVIYIKKKQYLRDEIENISFQIPLPKPTLQ